jgi:hypothetical protein
VKTQNIIFKNNRKFREQNKESFGHWNWQMRNDRRRGQRAKKEYEA